LAEVQLTKGLVALVDDSDLPLISGRQWYAHWRGGDHYAAANGTVNRGGRVIRVTLTMHRIILGVTDRCQIVDHKNGNTLDNRRCNLRICTYAQNKQNARKRKSKTSKYKGVIWVKGRKTLPWLANLRVNKKLVIIGRFNDEVEAAKAYDVAAIERYGEFACPNFPVEKEDAAKRNAPPGDG
jgi:hypothetical protein